MLTELLNISRQLAELLSLQKQLLQLPETPRRAGIASLRRLQETWRTQKWRGRLLPTWNQQRRQWSWCQQPALCRGPSCRWSRDRRNKRQLRRLFPGQRRLWALLRHRGQRWLRALPRQRRWPQQPQHRIGQNRPRLHPRQLLRFKSLHSRLQPLLSIPLLVSRFLPARLCSFTAPQSCPYPTIHRRAVRQRRHWPQGINPR